MSSANSAPTRGADSLDNRTRNQADLDLIHTTQQGNLDAFNFLVLTYQDQVFNQALWLLGDEAAAEDAAQEAFYRAYTRIQAFDGTSFRAWILRITINYCLDQLRRRKCHPMIPLEYSAPDEDGGRENSEWLVDHRPSPEQIAERADRCALINHCLMTLSPKDRAPIILIDIQEMNYQEAAEILRMPLGSFKSRLFRARTKLIEAINQVPGSDLLLL